MKANELMIGDWVLVEKIPTKVNGLAILQIMTDDHNYNEDDSVELEPIPLTEEILEKNGFRITHEHADYYFEENGEKMDFCMRKMYDKDNPKQQKGWSFYAFNVLTLVDYVHELQHALKLCGIEKEIVV